MARPEEVWHGWMKGKTFRLKEDVPHAKEYLGKWEGNAPLSRPTPYKVGDVVKVVMVSRFGDCGITTDLSKENGYAARVEPPALDPQDGFPEGVCDKCYYPKEVHLENGCK